MGMSAISLCSQAMIGLGCTTLASFDDGTAEAEVAANLYPTIRDAVLSSHPWNFATGQVTLARLTAAPTADYQYAYQLPTGFLRAMSAGQAERGRGLIYRINENRLETSADEVILTYIFRPDENAFPPYFALALIAKLRAEFCIPLTESTTRAQAMDQKAEHELRRARLIDAQQATPRAIEDFSLIDVRG